MSGVLQGVQDSLVFLLEFGRQAIAEAGQVLTYRIHLRFPLLHVDRKQQVENILVDVESVDINVPRPRQEADRRFARTGPTFASINDPAEDAQVLAETR